MSPSIPSVSAFAPFENSNRGSPSVPGDSPTEFPEEDTDLHMKEAVDKGLSDGARLDGIDFLDAFFTVKLVRLFRKLNISRKNVCRAPAHRALPAAKQISKRVPCYHRRRLWVPEVQMLFGACLIGRKSNTVVEANSSTSSLRSNSAFQPQFSFSL